MKIKSIFRNLNLIFVLVLITIFFIYRFNGISYGLPFFVNFDEMEFQSSTLSTLSVLTGYFEFNYNPFYAPLLNLIIILKYILINELLINSLSLDQIKSKIYFNPELFIFYGRAASLTITSFSIFFLHLIFKKLKIDFLIYSTLLITFTSSLVVFNISTIMSKNSFNLIIFLIQLYFFIKYLLKIDKFNYKSYFIFGLLASLAWGVNYWPAFISIYAVLLLHFKKFKFLKIHYFLNFLVIFVIFGPIINSLFVNMGPLDHISYWDNQNNPIKFDASFFIQNFFDNVFLSFKIIFLADKNILLLLAVMPIFLLNKYTNLKKEFLIIFFLIIGPIVIFGISGNFKPQLRYFAGVICVIIILTALIFNELKKTNFKYLGILLFVFNSCLIYFNVKQNNKINNVLSSNHSFFDFNENIKDIGIDPSKIFYIVDFNFQESLEQNLYYMKLYKNNLIKKNEYSNNIIKKIEKKIQVIKNTKKILIENQNLKKNIIFFNYSYFPIENYQLFFDFIKNDFEYVVIEESKPLYYSDRGIQRKIKNFVKENFLNNHTQFTKDKIFLRSQQSVIHYYTNTVSPYDFAENIDNENLEVVYGSNFSLYKLN